MPDSVLDRQRRFQSPAGGVLVAGAIGRLEHPVSTEFIGRFGGVEIAATPHLRARLRGAADLATHHGTSWGSVIPGRSESLDWVSASQERGGSGLMKADDRWVLFTDSLGLGPIYLRQLPGGVTLFANRLEPLVSVGPALTPDWLAWAETLVIGSPTSGRTHFAEIRRLEPASGVLVEKSGEIRPVGFLPRWLTYPDRSEKASAMAEVLVEALPGSRWARPPAVPLSGGWDSRILAAASSRFYWRRPEAWTVGQDDGRDRDLDLSPAVARALGMRHHVIAQQIAGWPELASEARRRFEFETWLHTWFVPLARAMRGVTGQFLDGLAGDVVVKGLFIDQDLLDRAEKDRPRILFERLGGTERRFEGLMHSEVAALLVGSARSEFLDVASRFQGHVSQLPLTTLWTRTTRVIAPAPLRLFGPEVRPWFPFLHPDFLTLALSIEPGEKLDGELSRKLLGLIGPSVAELPSTNDPGSPPPRTRYRLQASSEAVKWMVGLITSSEAASALFRSDVLAEMRSGSLRQNRPDFQTIRALQAGSLLADWEIAHRARLVSTDPPWSGL